MGKNLQPDSALFLKTSCIDGQHPAHVISASLFCEELQPDLGKSNSSALVRQPALGGDLVTVSWQSDASEFPRRTPFARGMQKCKAVKVPKHDVGGGSAPGWNRQLQGGPFIV